MIKNEKRGNCLLCAASSHMLVNIEASEKEHECIVTNGIDVTKGDKYEKDNYCNGK